MDLLALCNGTYEEALALIEKRAEDVASGRVKVAGNEILDTIRGYGNDAVDWAGKQVSQGARDAASQRVGQWWRDTSADPAKLGLLGLGAGAGVGALGSLARPKGRRRPFSGAMLGGLMGGAALGGLGLYNQNNLNKQTKSEQHGDAAEQHRKAVEEAAGLKNLDLTQGASGKDAPIPYRAAAGAAGDQVVDTVNSVARGANQAVGAAGDAFNTVAGVVNPSTTPRGPWSLGERFEGESDPHAALTGKALGTAVGIDAAGRRLRYMRNAGEDIHSGVDLGKVTLPKGLTPGDIKAIDTEDLRRGVGSLNPLPRGATPNLPAVVPKAAVPAQGHWLMPGYQPGTKEIPLSAARPAVPGHTLAKLRASGAAERGGLGFAGTGLSGKVMYPAMGITNYALNKLPQASLDADRNELDKWQKKLEAARAVKAQAATKAAKPKLMGGLLGKLKGTPPAPAAPALPTPVPPPAG